MSTFVVAFVKVKNPFWRVKKIDAIPQYPSVCISKLVGMFLYFGEGNSIILYWNIQYCEKLTFALSGPAFNEPRRIQTLNFFWQQSYQGTSKIK